MILSYNDIMAMGFRIGSDLKSTTVELAIDTAERYYLQPSISNDDYNAILALTANDPVIAGGAYTDAHGTTHQLAGLKKALGFIAYAELLRMNINATTFGSVQKDDEYSNNVDPTEQIRYFLTVGLQYINQVCKVKGFAYHPVTGVGRETYFVRKEEKGWR